MIFRVDLLFEITRGLHWAGRSGHLLLV
jgi:hypothetical protein